MYWTDKNSACPARQQKVFWVFLGNLQTWIWQVIDSHDVIRDQTAIFKDCVTLWGLIKIVRLNQKSWWRPIANSRRCAERKRANRRRCAHRKRANRRRCALRKRANRHCAQRGARTEIAHIYIYKHRGICKHTYIYENKNLYVDVHTSCSLWGLTRV